MGVIKKHMDQGYQPNYLYNNQPGYGPVEYGPDGQPLDGDRGLGKKLLVGAGVVALAVGAAIVIGGVYHYNKKQKKKKKVKVNGKTRSVNCDVLVDDRGIELPGQEFDETGRCVNEQEVLSRAVSNGQIQAQNQDQSYQQSYSAPYSSNVPYSNNYYNSPQPMMNYQPQPNYYQPPPTNFYQPPPTNFYNPSYPPMNTNFGPGTQMGFNNGPCNYPNGSNL